MNKKATFSLKVSTKLAIVSILAYFFLFLFPTSAQYVGESDICNNGDLMSQAFCTQYNPSIINMGKDKEAVGNHIFHEGNKYTLDIGDTNNNGKYIEKTDPNPVFTRIVRLLLTLTIVLAVSMIIINGILYITKSGSGGDPSKQRFNLLYIAIGILVALMSTIIITLFQSAGNDLKSISFGGQIALGGVAYADNGFELQIPKDKHEADLNIPSSVVSGKSDIRTVISGINDYLWRIIGFLCFAFLIYNGVLLIMSRGDEKVMSTATKGLLGSVIGIAICILSYSLVRIIVNLL